VYGSVAAYGKLAATLCWLAMAKQGRCWWHHRTPSGSITSTVSVNATAGFSVVTYTGTGANATVGHGLGVAPTMMIVKQSGTRETIGLFIIFSWCNTLI
jgi:hypothetical protein